MRVDFYPWVYEPTRQEASLTVSTELVVETMKQDTGSGDGLLSSHEISKLATCIFVHVLRICDDVH